MPSPISGLMENLASHGSNDVVETLALMKRRKKEFDTMTSSVLMEHQKHLLASMHFKAKYNDLLFLPSMLITLGSGMLAVAAQSEVFPDATQDLCTVLIAALASFSVFWQSLMKQLDFGGRALLHDSAASSLSKILQLAKVKSREQEVSEIEHSLLVRSPRKSPRKQDSALPIMVEKSENGDGTSLTDVPAKLDEEQVDKSVDRVTLSRQFEQAVQGCNSEVPIRISAAFETLDATVKVCNKKLVPSSGDKPRISWEKVYPALYHQLTLTIIGSRLWPYVIPDAEWAVKKTIKDFQKMDANVLQVLIDRTQQIDKVYGNLSLETTPLLDNTPTCVDNCLP